MELQQLRYLAAVARHRSFTAAAQSCHVSQPTLSQQIRKLEDEVGEPLLQRRRKGAYLTPLGERVHQHALEILRGVESVGQAATAFSSQVQGLVKIGVIPTIAPYLLPNLLRRSQRRYPAVRFHVTEEPTAQLLASIAAGALDLAVLSPPVNQEQVNLRDLFTDEFLLALPARHPLARTARVPLRAVRELPMILMNDAHCLRGQTLSFCQRAGFSPEVFIQSSQLDTVLAMVETGQGVSLVPAMARRAFRHRKVVLRSLRPERIERTISLAWSRQMHPTRAVAAFIEVCGTMPAPVRHGT